MTTTRPIVPFLWFDDQAAEAVEFYTSLFPESGVGSTARYGKEGFEVHSRPDGSVMTVGFRLAGRAFTALNGGPHFRFTPAISFFVVCETEAEVDALWAALAEDGATLMELGRYRWSEKYGWLNDRFGLSWQIALGRPADGAQRIMPFLMFTDAQCGRTEEAITRYVSIFDGSGIDRILRYGPGGATPEGHVEHARFTLGGQTFMAMDNALPHPFAFNEAISFQVMCETQAEIDRYWERLGEGGDPKARRCGWLKDEFGVSWQIVPAALSRLLGDPDPEKVGRVTKAFLQMEKFDIAALQQAYEG